MKSLLETLSTSNDVDFNKRDFIDLFKSLFCWSKLNNTQREVVADMFAEHGNIYEQLLTFRNNTNMKDPLYDSLKRMLGMSKDIYKELNSKI